MSQTSVSPSAPLVDNRPDLPLILSPPPAQQAMTAELDSDTGATGANLCCPSCLSCCLSCIACPVWLGSLRTIEQNEHCALMVWGKYTGSLTEPGLRILNPIGTELRRISTARQTMEMKELKIVDAKGNPILISANCCYRIFSVKKARVDVQDARVYLWQQAPIALRKVVSRYTYDMLRSDLGGQVGQHLVASLQELVTAAGVQILNFDLTDLSYSAEIAPAMLVKQQADAMIEARRLVAEGAVSIACESAASVSKRGYNLSKEGEERLINNVLTVICSHNGVVPTMHMV